MSNLTLMIVCLIFIFLVGTNGQSFPRLHHHGGKMNTLVSLRSEQYVEQPISHFEDLGKTWKQMYIEEYIALNHKGLKDNVAFLSIGGERPGCEIWGMMSKWAPLHNASQFCLEHRYYGSSRPFPEQTVENLKYLSSREMIGDLKYFIEYINKKNEWIGTRWIVFGGSYSGSLAAWLRKLHPETVVGAVASSAPLEARLNFLQFYDLVDSIYIYGPGGSQKCRDQLRKAFEEATSIINTLQKVYPEELNKLFKVKPPFEKDVDIWVSFNDEANFYEYLITNFWIAVQYSSNRSPKSIENVCKIMNENKLLDGLSLIVAQPWNDFKPPFINNYTAVVERFKDTTYNDLAIATDRSWLWQKCTEFGYFQTTDRSEIFWGELVISYFTDICWKVFGDRFGQSFISKAINETNKYYGGIDGYNATNVVLTIGEFDPWGILSKVRSDNESQTIFEIKGASHCGDMDDSGDPIFEEVHKVTADRIEQWINGSKK